MEKYNFVLCKVHSTETKQWCTLEKRVGENEFHIRTGEGILAHAIFNVFTGLYYVDDVNEKINESGEENE